MLDISDIDFMSEDNLEKINNILENDLISPSFCLKNIKEQNLWCTKVDIPYFPALVEVNLSPYHFCNAYKEASKLEDLKKLTDQESIELLMNEYCVKVAIKDYKDYLILLMLEKACELKVSTISKCNSGSSD